MKYVSPKYEQQLNDLAETLMTSHRERLGLVAVAAMSEDEQAEASITALREECIADEEARLGVFNTNPNPAA